MNENPYTVLLLGAAMGSGVAAFFTWRRVRAVGAKCASLSLLFCAEWLATYAAEMNSADLTSKIFWNKLEYVGVVALPTTFLLFSLLYTRRGKWVNRRIITLLALEPLSMLALIATNDAHRLFWASNALDASGHIPVLVDTYGLAFWLNLAYSYSLLIVVAYLLLQLRFRSAELYRGQINSLTIAVLAPWLSNLLFVTHLNPFPFLNLAPLSFVVSSLAIVWGISGMRLEDISTASRRAAVESMDDGVIVLDVENRIVDANPAARRIMGELHASSVGLPIERLLPDWSEPLASSEKSEDSNGREITMRHGETEQIYEMVTSPVKDWRGELVSRVVVLRDITLRKRLENELAQRYEEAMFLADRDSVTGLLNHRALHKRLEQELKRAARRGQTLSVMMMDVDGFKLINDTYGHPVGDQVLRLVSTVFAKSTRGNDIFGRYGGDEFAAVLPETSTHEAIAVAERLRAELAERPYVSTGLNRVPIRLSYGIATYPFNGLEIHELMGFADANLYESKQLGGNTITVGGDREDPTKVGTFSVLDGLVTAVDHKDRYTREHSENVTNYAMAIASKLGLSEESQRTLRIAGLLHDIGKIGVPDRVLRKPGPLNEEETAVVRQHVALSELIIQEVPNQADVVAAVSSHHERVDGAGYPRGLKGEDIPLLGRILAVADAYSAMTTDRPYRKALAAQEAMRELLNVAGTQLDAAIVDLFVELLSHRERLVADEETFGGLSSSNSGDPDQDCITPTVV